MRATLDDSALVKNHNNVGILNGGKSVGDNEYRSALHKTVHTCGNYRFGSGVYARRCFVKNQNGRVCNRRTGNCDKLSLSLRKTCTVGGEHRVISLRQMADKVICVYKLCRRNYFFVRCIESAVTDVICNRTREQMCFLKHHAERTAEVCFLYLVDIDAVVSYLAVLNVVKSVDKIRYRRFTAPVAPTNATF